MQQPWLVSFRVWRFRVPAGGHLRSSDRYCYWRKIENMTHSGIFALLLVRDELTLFISLTWRPITRSVANCGYFTLGNRTGLSESFIALSARVGKCLFSTWLRRVYPVLIHYLLYCTGPFPKGSSELASAFLCGTQRFFFLFAFFNVSFLSGSRVRHGGVSLH